MITAAGSEPVISDDFPAARAYREQAHSTHCKIVIQVA
jgi:hypothetical protein